MHYIKVIFEHQIVPFYYLTPKAAQCTYKTKFLLWSLRALPKVAFFCPPTLLRALLSDSEGFPLSWLNFNPSLSALRAFACAFLFTLNALGSFSWLTHSHHPGLSLNIDFSEKPSSSTPDYSFPHVSLILLFIYLTTYVIFCFLFYCFSFLP